MNSVPSINTAWSINTVLLGAEHGAENGFWLPHDIWEVFWGTLAFLVVVGLLWKFAAKPGSDYFAKRTDGIAAGLDDARSAREAAEHERDSIKDALANADSEAARIIEESRQSADVLVVEIARRAERDVLSAHERGEADLAATRAQVEADLSGELSRMALGAAERVVEGTLDDANQQRLIDAFINDVGSRN